MSATLVLIGLMAWEYAPAMRGAFLYEDYRTVDVCAVPTPWQLQGRKLAVASWCAQLAAGASPFAWHAVNVLLHLAVTGLVGLVTWQFTHDRTVALLAMGWFGLNAVSIEAVAYLSNRSELIAALGVVGACAAAVARWWWLIPVALLIGYGGKESAIVGLLLVPLCLWYQRGAVWGWVTGGASVAVWIAVAVMTASWWLYVPVSPVRLILTQLVAMARVALVSVVPFGLTVDYDYAIVPLGMRLCSASALIAALAWAWRSRRTHRLRWCGACWTALALSPRLIVPTPWSPFSEHQFYLPLVGMTLILASVVTEESYGHYRAAL